MLTSGKKMALNAMLRNAVSERDMDRDWLGFVGAPFNDLEEVCQLVQQAGFHIIDCELFRKRRVETDEFCALIEFDSHTAFALLLPRSIPFTLAYFLYQAAEHGIVSTDSGWTSYGQYRSLAGKAWIVIMTPEDFEHAELETGWDRSRLDRVLSNHCWLHDTRYDRKDTNNHPSHLGDSEALRVVDALDTGWRESIRLMQQQDFDAIVNLWNPLRESSAFRLDYELWSNDPTIRFKLMNARADLFVALAQGTPVPGESEPFRAAYAVLEDLVGCASFVGGGNARFSDGNARDGNTMLFNTLSWAKKWLDHHQQHGFLPIAVGKSEDDICALVKQLQRKLAALSGQRTPQP